jgi:hypothetical protein
MEEGVEGMEEKWNWWEKEKRLGKERKMEEREVGKRGERIEWREVVQRMGVRWEGMGRRGRERG